MKKLSLITSLPLLSILLLFSAATLSCQKDNNEEFQYNNMLFVDGLELPIEDVQHYTFEEEDGGEVYTYHNFHFEISSSQYSYRLDFSMAESSLGTTIPFELTTNPINFGIFTCGGNHPKVQI
ncbi:MAG: hypothetical protein WC960_05920 [Bacteroidales bacterium]